MTGDAYSSLPPPERGRTASEARRVGVRPRQLAQYNRTPTKTARARTFRQRSTEAETRLWSRLRGTRLDGLSFRRQHPAGPYFLDFYCPEFRLAIELDGGQHTFSGQEAYDSKRTTWLRKCGVTEIRFWNNEVAKNINGVLEKIKEAADELRSLRRTPTRRWRADLPLSGRGEK